MRNKGAQHTRGLAPRPAKGLDWSRPRRRLTDLAPRVASSLVLAAAPLTAVWLGGAIFSMIWFIATLAVGWEWQTLIGAARPRLRFLAAAAALALATYLAEQQHYLAACAILALGGALAALAADTGKRVWAFCGVPYAGALIVSVSLLYFSPTDGSRAIFWLCATVWGTDVFAYFGGRLIGGPKLWPQISPSKTWSGTLCGVVAGALLGAIVGAHGVSGTRLLAPIFALGLVTAIVSQAGDIFESFVKRRFGVKDSSALIPGHGGFMDRLDGFIAAAAFAALVGALHGAPGASAAGLFDWG
ncbi:phosphatidate cytidylyltransferase [Methylocella silvestris]|uniref:Phosphatidate cytidylyltransferase n=1 Tax=Methylocella silvestris TaxID=199596 RepID=A0A2J7TM50_METSI|nr:phosphatidate cytidylyltransferase [Methylocella silvestris]PNG27851.1 phosphatidate cytidylyltransferase [Methylocella silvestris]